MAKTVSPGEISIDVAGESRVFKLTAVPDPFDDRDLEYRPRLQPLPKVVDNRDEVKARLVLDQGRTASCTGHAVATVISTILASQNRRELESGGCPPQEINERVVQLSRVSPYMIYYMARRYDEFEGEEDAGSSLRGAFKGWFNHGVCPWDLWTQLHPEIDLEDETFLDKCREVPLGAYYRINPFRLDDMQSAIYELDAIAVSAAIHDGWERPQVWTKNGEKMHVIERSRFPRLLGGHAFTIVGYNEVGFLVQNSWGPKWGSNGFATLPYEDWLESAYDAWVARPGVPKTPFYKGRSFSFAGTNGAIVSDEGPDLKRLYNHVINLGNNGRFSDWGKFRSRPHQLNHIFDHIQQVHDQWAAQHTGEEPFKRRIVIYAHGGMVSEKSGLDQADTTLNWWLNNQVYPIYFAWQSGPGETVLNQLLDLSKVKLPAGGIGIDLEEQFDRYVEGLARKHFTLLWDEMKENARRASDELPHGFRPVWPVTQVIENEWVSWGLPGGSLFVARLAEYIRQCEEENVEVSLVGHSAGSIFHAALLQRLIEAQIKVKAMVFLAPGIRVDEFKRDIYPHLGSWVQDFALFILSEELEQNDSCSRGFLTVYHKSLLYLVARGLERHSGDCMFEVPLLGLQSSLRLPYQCDSQETAMDLLHSCGSSVIVSRSLAPDDSCCTAVTHGDFDNDPATMTSVLLRVLGRKSIQTVQAFQPHAELLVPVAAAEISVAPPPVAAAEVSMEAAPAPAPAPDGGNGHEAETAGEAGEMRAFARAASPGATPSSGSTRKVGESPTPISTVLSRLGWSK